MKIIGFAGSTHTKSINLKLVKYTLSNFEQHETQLLNLNDFPLPLYSEDYEGEKGFPENVVRFVDALRQADGFVVSMAEHNGSYTAAAKNLLDWCSRFELEFFQNQPMLLLSTSPGGYGGGNLMEAAQKRFPKFGAQIVSTFKLPSFYDHFSEDEGITDNELRLEFQNELEQFLSRLER